VIHPKFGNFIALATVLIDAEVTEYTHPIDYLTFHVKSWKAEEKRVLAKVDYGRYSG